MKRNKGYLQLSFDNKYKELVDRRIINPLKRNKISFYIDSLKLFFKEESKGYIELIGFKIAKLLNIDSANYDLLEFITEDASYKGVVSEDFREDGYQLITIDKIIDDYLLDSNEQVMFNEMNLELLFKAISSRYQNYDNSDIIISKIMDKLKRYFLFDILIGNIDNGKYNYELMESNYDAKITPYFDYEQIFKFSSTRFTASDSGNYDVYGNLLEFLSKETDYIPIFMEMYRKLTPEKIETIINEIEKEIGSKISDNDKSIIFLAYSRHYYYLGNILDKVMGSIHTKK